MPDQDQYIGGYPADAYDSNAISFTGIGEPTSNLLPSAVYPANVSDVKKGDGPKGEYIGFEFAIADGEYAGKKKFMNCSLSNEAKPYTRKTLAVLEGGAIPDEGYTWDNIWALRGVACRIQLGQERGQDGEMRNKVIRVLPFVPQAQNAPATATPQRGIAPRSPNVANVPAPTARPRSTLFPAAPTAAAAAAPARPRATLNVEEPAETEDEGVPADD